MLLQACTESHKQTQVKTNIFVYVNTSNPLMKSKSTQLPNYLRKKDNRLKDKFDLLPFGSDSLYKNVTNSFLSIFSSTHVISHHITNLKSTEIQS